MNAKYEISLWKPRGEQGFYPLGCYAERSHLPFPFTYNFESPSSSKVLFIIMIIISILLFIFINIIVKSILLQQLTRGNDGGKGVGGVDRLRRV